LLFLLKNKRNMQTIYGIYDQIALLLARLDPSTLLSLRASPDMQMRFEYLTNAQHVGRITAQEKDELEHFVVLERLIRLAKIRADQSSSAS
jgi:tRNA isopentenyl-2-thiomethyl-A-37 hydroxylase MiaE